MDEVAQMYELQRVDLTWLKVAKRLKQIQQLLGENEQLKTARAAAAGTEARLHSYRATQQNAELESLSLGQRIQATETKLMSGEVRNPKELDTLQQSLEALRRQRAMVEEHAMEAMLQGDQTADKLATQQGTLKTIENAWRAGQSHLIEEETKLKHNFVLLKRKRESLAQSMGAPILDRYETMRKRKAGVAVAQIQNGVCAACHVRIPTGIVNGLGGSSALVLCPSCGRYLYGG